MSRIGKKPVSVPAGVTASVTGQLVKIKGSKGELSFEVPEDVSVAMEDGAIAVQPRSQSKRARALWGTSRARINNLVIGTTAGFEKRLEINGVGYKAAVAGKVLKLSLGYSHDIDYEIPAGVAIVTPNNMRLFADRAYKAGRPLPISISIGTHPLEIMASGYRAPLGVDEMHIAGGLRGEPIALAPCKTIDVPYIADAEIVLEAG